MTEQTTSPESADKKGQIVPPITKPTTVDEISADVASLFAGFDESHKKELASEEENAAIEAEEYHEKAEQMEEITTSIKKVKYSPDNAFEVVKKLASALDNAKKELDTDLPSIIEINLRKYEQIKQMLEQRRAAVGDDKVKKLENKIRNSKQLRDIFETLKADGTSVVAESIEAIKQKRQEALLKTKRAKTAMEDYPDFAVKSEVAPDDLETAKKLFLSRATRENREALFNNKGNRLEILKSKLNELNAQLESYNKEKISRQIQYVEQAIERNRTFPTFFANMQLQKISAIFEKHNIPPREQIEFLNQLSVHIKMSKNDDTLSISAKNGIFPTCKPEMMLDILKVLSLIMIYTEHVNAIEQKKYKKTIDANQRETSLTNDYCDLFQQLARITSGTKKDEVNKLEINDNRRNIVVPNVSLTEKQEKEYTLWKKDPDLFSFVETIDNTIHNKPSKNRNVTPDGIPYRPEHREHDIQKYKANMKLLEKLARESKPTEEGVITKEKTRQFLTVESAVAEIERVRAMAIEAIVTLRDTNKAMDLLMRMDELGVEGTKLLKEKSEGADVAEKLRQHKAEMQKLGKEIKDLTKKTDLNS